MNYKQQIISAFYNNGYRMRLGDILKFPWGYEARARFTELRKEGYTIICQKAKKASDNLYTMVPPEPDGQMRMI